MELTQTRPITASEKDIDWGRMAGLITCGILFEFLVYLASLRWAPLDPFTWALLAIAASFVGRAISYMSIFEWLRIPFGKVVPHESGLGEYVSEKCDSGYFSAFCSLVTCPICAGTWAGAGLLVVYLWFPHFGTPMLYILAAASLAAFFSHLTEVAEWGTAAFWEYAGHKRRSNLTSEN